MINRWLFTVLAVIGFGLPAMGQALADRVPADALVYIGWSGTDALTGDFDKSTFKKLTQQTHLTENLGQVIPAIMEIIAKNEPGAAEPARALGGLMQLLAHRPVAIYFGGATVVDRNPNAKFAIICDGGNNPAGLLKAIKDFSEKSSAPVTADLHAGRYIAIGVVYPVPDAVEELLAENAGDSLAKLPDFKKTIEKTSPNAALTVYLDGVKLTKMVDGLMESAGSQDDKRNWKNFKVMFAFEDMRHLTLTSGFVGADWSTRVFIDAPAKMTDTNRGTDQVARRGIPGLMESSPVSADLMKLIPADATVAMGLNFNPDQLSRKLIAMGNLDNPNFSQRVASSVKQIKEETGIDYQSDLLASLGSDWGAFLSPSIAGNMPNGIVMVNKLANPAKFNDVLNKLKFEYFVNPVVAESMGRDKAEISIRTAKAGKYELHYLTTPIVSPTMAVNNGVLYVGLYPQSVIAAMDYVAQGGKSILENPSFASMNKKIGGDSKPTAFTYVDLPALSSGGYGAALMLNRIVAGFSDIFGKPMPEPMMPTLSKLRENLTPVGTIQWQDESGFYLRSVSPAPLVDLPGMSANTLSSAIGVFVADQVFLGYSTNRAHAKEQLLFNKCDRNMRLIVTEIDRYAEKNQGKYPQNLGVLALEQKIKPECFICSKSAKTAPPGLEGDALVKWVNDNSDFDYLGADMTLDKLKDIGNEARFAVLLYEKTPVHFDPPRIPAFFFNKNTGSYNPNTFAQSLERTKQILGK